MKRNTRIALIVSALTVLCTVGVCLAVLRISPSLVVSSDCPDPAKPTAGPVVDSTQRIDRMYPKLAPLETAHWQDIEVVPRTCPEVAPQTHRTEGLVVLSPQKAQEFADYDWTPASAPEVTADLRKHLPAAPQWLTSRRFETEVGGHFRYDKGTRTLYLSRLSD